MDKARFSPIYAIPDDWLPFALPALKFQKTRRAVFNAAHVAKNYKTLLALPKDTNPFNAVRAAQVLAPGQGLDANFVREVVAPSTGYKQAILTYLTFKYTHPLQQTDVDKAFTETIEQAKTAATLKWLALGILTPLGDDDDTYYKLIKRTQPLFQSREKHQRVLNTQTPEDAYLNDLLVQVQVRKRVPLGVKSSF